MTDSASSDAGHTVWVVRTGELVNAPGPVSRDGDDDLAHRVPVVDPP